MRHRIAFTAIELVVVMAIIALLAGMAMPAASTSLRRSALNTSANIVVEAWRKARLLALSHPLPACAPGEKPRHFGLLLRSAPEGVQVAVIYDNRDVAAITADPQSAILHDNAAISLNDRGSSPAPAVFRERLASTIELVADNANQPLNGAIVVYAQYRTGVPIQPTAVAAGSGPLAKPCSLGLPPVTLSAETIPGVDVTASSIAPVLRLQSRGWDPSQKRGRATRISIFHAGASSITDL